LRPLYEASAINSWIASLSAAKFERVTATGEALLVAESVGEVVGFVSYHGEMCSLGMWYVDPAVIGRGVGKALLRLAEDGLRESGCAVATTEASLYARPVFLHLGWEEVEVYEKSAFGGRFTATRMKRALR
jgi:GNAT superfamily N-acetyltransferase